MRLFTILFIFYSPFNLAASSQGDKSVDPYISMNRCKLIYISGNLESQISNEMYMASNKNIVDKSLSKLKDESDYFCNCVLDKLYEDPKKYRKNSDQEAKLYASCLKKVRNLPQPNKQVTISTYLTNNQIEKKIISYKSLKKKNKESLVMESFYEKDQVMCSIAFPDDIPVAQLICSFPTSKSGEYIYTNVPIDCGGTLEQLFSITPPSPQENSNGSPNKSIHFRSKCEIK